MSLSLLSESRYAAISGYINEEVLSVGADDIINGRRGGYFRLTIGFCEFNTLTRGVDVVVGLSYVVNNGALKVLGDGSEEGDWAEVSSYKTDLSLLIQGGYIHPESVEAVIEWVKQNLTLKTTLPIFIEEGSISGRLGETEVTAATVAKAASVGRSLTKKVGEKANLKFETLEFQGAKVLTRSSGLNVPAGTQIMSLDKMVATYSNRPVGNPVGQGAADKAALAAAVADDEI